MDLLAFFVEQMIWEVKSESQSIQKPPYCVKCGKKKQI